MSDPKDDRRDDENENDNSGSSNTEEQLSMLIGRIPLHGSNNEYCSERVSFAGRTTRSSSANYDLVSNA